MTAPERGRALAEGWRGKLPAFVCTLGHTDVCLVPGISSAGVREELRPLTPAADAEVVLAGRPLCLSDLPSNPTGAPGPAGITRAALDLAGVQAEFIGAGLRVWPAVDCQRFEIGAPLFERGVELGRSIAAPYVVIGESVPGGTTTALALLLALGYAAEGRVSGSMPGNAHSLKARIAHERLSAAGLGTGEGRRDPLAAASMVGDPMQPLAAGLAFGAARAGRDVLLAGGSQMVAVAALIAAVGGPAALERIAIGTTRWIVDDPSADVSGLTSEVSRDLPLLAANLNFSGSRHPGLQSYEGYLVKEGVGAGGACIAALLASGQSLETLHAQIDQIYDSLLGRLTAQ